MSMAFLETLIKWEESSPLDVARALREADAFAAHHEDLARYARGLAGRIAQETGGFTGDEFSLDSSAPQSPTKDFPRSPPTPKRKAPLSPLAGGPLPLGLPPRRAGAAAGPNPYDLDSPDVASYASLEHRIERRASFDRCSEERASYGEALAYCDGDEGNRKKALLRAAKARVARRRLLAAKGGVIAGKPLAREAALLHEVLRRNTNGVRGAEDEHFAPPPARGPRATTINGLGRRVDAGGLRGGSGPPGRWRRNRRRPRWALRQRFPGCRPASTRATGSWSR